jgi:hypothetical protein
VRILYTPTPLDVCKFCPSPHKKRRLCARRVSRQKSNRKNHHCLSKRKLFRSTQYIVSSHASMSFIVVFAAPLWQYPSHVIFCSPLLMLSRSGNLNNGSGRSTFKSRSFQCTNENVKKKKSIPNIFLSLPVSLYLSFTLDHLVHFFEVSAPSLSSVFCFIYSVLCFCCFCYYKKINRLMKAF